MTIEIEKNKLRSDFIARRKLISLEENKILSNKIANNFYDFINISNLVLENKILASYKSTIYEVNPIYIEEKLKNFKTKFCFPKINDEKQSLDFYESNNFIFNKKYNKILEPDNGDILIPDYIMVPLVAFDENLNRLGMGKGFYDRTIIDIKLLNPNLRSIGLGFDFQKSSKILPINNNDKSLDFVVTPSKIYCL